MNATPTAFSDFNSAPLPVADPAAALAPHCPQAAAGTNSSSCGGVERRLAHAGLEASGAKTNPDRLDTGMVTPFTAPLLAAVARGPQDSIPKPTPKAPATSMPGVETSAGALPPLAPAAFSNERYVTPLGISLLFCSRAQIEAAPVAEREGYYRIVDGLVANPEACGFRRETATDLQADDAVDRGLSGLNNDWTAP